MDFLAGFNIQTTDSTGNLRRMRDILVDISKVMANMGTAERINFAEKVFDARGSLGGGTLAVNTKAIDDFVKKLDSSAGAASQTAQKMDEGIGGTLRRLSRAAEGFSRTMGQMIGEAFQPILNFSTSVILALRDLANEFPLLTKGLALTAGGAAAVGAALFVITTAGKLIGSTVANIKNLAAAITGSATAAAQADKLKNLESEASNARRIALENKRHLNEMQNAAREAAAAVVAAEKQKLAASEARVRQEIANNEKAKYAYTLQNGSAKGFVQIPELTAAQDAMQKQTLAVQAAEDAYKKSGAAASQAAAAYDASKTQALAAAAAHQNFTLTARSAWTELRNVAAAQQGMNASSVAFDAAAKRFVQTLGMTGTAAEVASAKILAMNNAAAGQAGLTALSGALQSAKAAILQFVTASDAWSFTTLKNINLTKLFTAAQLALGNAFSWTTAKTVISKKATAALGIATKGAAAAFLAAKAAVIKLWTAMKAHPVIAVAAAVAALTAAFAALMIQIKKYQETELQSHADKYREKQEKIIEADGVRMQRLQQLAGKQKLTNDEMKQAETIISNLKKYGDDLGITLDKQTGQLTAAAGAWEKLKKAMDDKKIGLIDRVIKQEEENVRALRDELKRFSETKYLKNKDGSYVKRSSMGKEEQEARIKAIQEELDRRLEKIAALKEEQKLVRNPPKVKDDVEQEIQQQEKLSKEVEKAQKAQLAAEEKLARMNRTDLENKIHDIQKARDEYKKNIQVQIDYEKGQRNQDQKKIKELEQKLTEADKVYQIQIDKAKEEQQKSFESDLKAMREDYQRAQRELELSRQQRKEDRQIDEAARESPDNAVRMIDKMLLDLAKQIEESKKKVQKALEEAAKPDKKGNVSKEAQKNLRDARSELARQQSRQDSLQGKREQIETQKREQSRRDQEQYGDKISKAEEERNTAEATKQIDEEIKKALKNNLQSGIAMINSLIDKFSAAADAAKKAYEEAYKNAMSDGAINRDERKNLDELFKKYTFAAGQTSKYRDKLAEGVRTAQQETPASRGIFNAADIDSLLHGTQDPTEEINKKMDTVDAMLSRIYNKMGNLGIKFA
jgi:hypothetical protein